MPAPLNVQQIALYMSKRRASSRQEVAAAAEGEEGVGKGWETVVAMGVAWGYGIREAKQSG